MRTFKINGKVTHIFVLKETDERMCYIPVDSIDVTSRQELAELEALNPNDMLKTMRNTTLSNGLNALVNYDKIIRVLVKDSPNSGVSLPRGTRYYENPKNELIAAKKIAKIEEAKSKPKRGRPAGSKNKKVEEVEADNIDDSND